MSMSLQDKNICFTGMVDGFTRSTDILVVGENAGDVKLKKAQQLGIKIWSAEDFLMMLGQDDADGIPDVQSPKRDAKARAASEPERQAYYDKDPEVGMF